MKFFSNLMGNIFGAYVVKYRGETYTFMTTHEAMRFIFIRKNYSKIIVVGIGSYFLHELPDGSIQKYLDMGYRIRTPDARYSIINKRMYVG